MWRDGQRCLHRFEAGRKRSEEGKRVVPLSPTRPCPRRELRRRLIDALAYEARTELSARRDATQCPNPAQLTGRFTLDSVGAVIGVVGVDGTSPPEESGGLTWTALGALAYVALWVVLAAAVGRHVRPMTLFALVAKFEDQPGFLWTTPSLVRQPHEHAREVYERNAPWRYAMPSSASWKSRRVTRCRTPVEVLRRRRPSGRHACRQTARRRRRAQTARGRRCAARLSGSPLRLAGRDCAPGRWTGAWSDDVSRGWAPLTEARVEMLPPLVKRAAERAMDKCFDEIRQGRPHEAVLYIPGLRLRSGDNGRGDWRGRAARVKRERRIVALVPRRGVLSPSRPRDRRPCRAACAGPDGLASVCEGRAGRGRPVARRG